MPIDRVDDVFRSAISRGVFPGAVVLVTVQGHEVFHRCYGWRMLQPERRPMTEDTIFDLSSLTKPIATTTAMMLLVGDGKLDLDEPVCSVIPSFGNGRKRSVTFRLLLNHGSGLPAWRPYYRELVQKSGGGAWLPRSRATRTAFFWGRLDTEPLVVDPGKRAIYSDLGFMLLGRAIERVSGVPFDEFCRERIFAPLGLECTLFLDLCGSPGSNKRARFAATELCRWRGRALCGEVHDDNAFAMGGIAGHAGLFSNALDLHRFMVCLRACYLDRKPSFLQGSVVRSFLECGNAVEGSTHLLGWDTPAPHGSAAGRWFSRKTVGHLGYTGTSLWWDLERDITVLLLTNRVHPRRDNDGIKEFRPLVHDAIMETLLR
jgi:CubicO group peptidase (beta-lactamase class C family)